MTRLPPVGLNKLSSLAELERHAPIGSRWRNRWTREEDVVLESGPCANLNGELRIRLKAEQAKWTSNGWSADWGQGGFFFCWERIEP